MGLLLDYLPYRRRFVKPLRTAHGPWHQREGLLLRLRLGDGGCRCGYGEIAPLPWFGTETLAAAIALLHQLRPPELPRLLSSAVETWLPPGYPATAFGLGLAMAQLRAPIAAPELANQLANPKVSHRSFDLQEAASLDHPRHLCALLPSGRAALAAWPELYERGHRTFKLKIGLAAPAQERANLAVLRRSLPRNAQLRLDANASLDLTTAAAWLDCCDDLAEAGYPMEFLEQPLAPTALAETIALGQRYRTPLALDESVASLAQLKQCHDQGWRGIVVIKGAISGDPRAVLAWCQAQALDVVWSSVFETALGRRGVLALAVAQQAAVPTAAPRALGFGIGQWLVDDGLGELALPETPAPVINPPAITGEEALWQRLLSCSSSEPRTIGWA